MTTDSQPADLGLTSQTRVIYYVRDFDAAVAFYTDLLGLKLAYPAGGGWAEFQAGNSALCLHEGRSSDQPSNGLATFGWRVEDLDASVAALRARGLTATDPTTVTEGLRCTEFHDPDGNALFFEGA